jgi:peptidoglycan hydrolase CwlO-like protein
MKRAEIRDRRCAVAHRILWVVAGLLAMMALVAGCFAPKEPLVVIGTGQRQAPPATQSRIRAMDRQTLENETLRLAAENDALRQENEKLKRENKSLKQDKERLENQIEDLNDQIKNLRRR